MSLSRSITLGSSLDVLLQWFSFFIVYQSVCIFFRQRAARLSLLLVQLGAGLSSLALLVTGLGLLPVKAPMASTFGNRNFLSEYLVLSLPVGIAVLSTAKSRSEKIFLLLSVLTQFLALVMASSQGAWLGCFASGIFLLLLQRGRVKHILGSLLGNQGLDEAVSFAGKPRVGADSAHTTADLGLLEKRPLRTKIVPRSVVAGLILLVGVVTVVFFTKGPNVLEDTLRVFDFQHRNIQMRLHVWKASARLIAENAFLGTGLGSYDETFPRFRDPQEWASTGTATQANWAHNVFIHVAVETGLLGLLAFLWIVVSCVSLARRESSAMRGGTQSTILSSLGAAWLGTFVCSLVGTNFHHSANLFLLAAYAGLLDSRMGIRVKLFRDNARSRRTLSALSCAPVVMFALGLLSVRSYLSDQILAMGIRQYNGGNETAAVSSFERAIAVAPDTKAPRSHLGLVYYQMENKKKAAEVYAGLAHGFPNDPQIHYNLGLALEANERLQEAVQAYQRALDLNPEFLTAKEKLGRCLAGLEKHTEALAFLEQAIRQGSKDEGTWIRAGDEAAALEFYKQAAEFYEGAVRLAPADGAVWYNMGLYWQRAGLLKEAISAYRQAISRDAELAYAYNNLGLCLMLTGKVREAGEVLNAGLQKDQRSPDIHFNLALVYRTIGDNAKAESYLERAKALAPERKHIQVTVEELDDWLERMH